MTSSRLALRALNSLCSINVQTHTQKGRYTMGYTLKIKNLVGLVALALVSFVGCGVDTADEPLAPVTLNVDATAASCHSDCSAVKFCVRHTDTPPNTVNPSESGSCIDLNLSSGKGSGSFADLGKPGLYFLAFNGLPAGLYVHYSTDGFMVTNTMELYRSVNTLSVVIDNNNTGTGGSGGSAGDGGVGGEAGAGGNTGGTGGTAGSGGDAGGAGGDAGAGGEAGAGGDAGAGGSDGGAPPNSGKLCMSIQDIAALSVPGCTIDYVQANPDPTPSSSPPASCDEAGDYYFEAVTAGPYDLVVTCPDEAGTLTGQVKVTIVAGQTQHLWMTVLAPVATGTLCVGKLGLPIDLDTTSANMGQWLGYGDGNTCTPATPAQLATMTVVDFSQFSGPGACADKNDPNCAIVLTGLVASMKNGFSGYQPNEERIFEVVVKDDSEAGAPVSVYIDTLNGYFQ